jgi:glyoxylase-like metal-dependent hydrolase (beta-lactamase superfamily II)
MRIHHLNCISSCALGGALMDGVSVGKLRGRLTAHCLLLEAERELILVDTGYGLQDVADPHGRLSEFFLMLNAPEFRDEMTAVRQIEALGFDPIDVRHIVLSHLDFDHAGGLDDFPQATVHLLRAEDDAATARRTMLDKMRYRPQQWSTRAQWKTYEPQAGEVWFGFDCVRRLAGLPPEVLLVPLIGHTLGHAGVAIAGNNGWLLYAADAYFFHQEMRAQEPYCTSGLRFYQALMEKDRAQRLGNQARLRDLAQRHAGEISVFCAHDVVEFERISGRSHRDPIGPQAASPKPQNGRAWSSGLAYHQ